MLKRNLFLILSLLITIILFLTAATCNMCGVSVSDEEGQQTSADENTTTSSNTGSSTDTQGSQDKSQDSKADDPSSQNGSNNNGSDSKSQDSQQNGSNKNDQKNYDIEITDIVVGDVVDEHVEPASFFFTDSYYTCYPVINTQLDGTETFDWAVSGGSCDNGGFYMQWYTPPDEGYYTISLNVHMGDAWGFYNEDFYIEPLTDMGPPLEGPQITGIRIEAGVNDVVDTMGLNSRYAIYAEFDDPTGLAQGLHTSFDVDKGTIVSIDNGVLVYDSPDFETDVNITVILNDMDFNYLVQETFISMVRDNQ